MAPRGLCESASEASAGTAVRRKILSPQTTGEADPRPGISTFHRMFFVSLHSSGGVALREMPLATGPRHIGQKLSADGAWARTATTAAEATTIARRKRVDIPVNTVYRDMEFTRQGISHMPKGRAIPYLRDVTVVVWIVYSIVGRSWND
jgi:hypothetical protein